MYVSGRRVPGLAGTCWPGRIRNVTGAGLLVRRGPVRNRIRAHAEGVGGETPTTHRLPHSLTETAFRPNLTDPARTGRPAGEWGRRRFRRLFRLPRPPAVVRPDRRLRQLSCHVGRPVLRLVPLCSACASVFTLSCWRRPVY
jgi:hypothetical protein